MTNQAINTNDFQASTGTVVNSSFIYRVEFGQVEFSGVQLDAVLVEFAAGHEYIYLGVTRTASETLQAAIELQHQGDTDISIGRVFNQVLRPFQCYARLHSSL